MDNLQIYALLAVYDLDMVVVNYHDEGEEERQARFAVVAFNIKQLEKYLTKLENENNRIL